MGRVLVLGRTDTLAAKLRANPGLLTHEVYGCDGCVSAVQRVRDQRMDVVLTDPETSVSEDLAFARELTKVRPGTRVIVLAPVATTHEVIAALREHVFACFTAPFEPAVIADMVRAALAVSEWRDGIEVVSGLPHWLTLRVSCHLLTAERLISFMSELQAAMPDDERDLLIAAFRELLLNAMEHGAGFDAEKVIEVTAAKTRRAIVYHFQDPGPGFDIADLKHACGSGEPDEVLANVMHRAELGLRPGGFGMLIARQVADELVYNERHNEVLLIKYLD